MAYQDNPAFALQLDEIQESARSLGLKLQIVEVQHANEFEKAFEAVKNERAGALNVLASAFFSAHRKGIIELAAKYRVPAVYHTEAFVENGGLIFYGPTIPDLHRRAATYVDKILKGAKPADLPIEQPKKFEFVVNLKTAKQIGLIIPPNVLARADRVITK
jgi:putative ABC transport system substrate-binding protein